MMQIIFDQVQEELFQGKEIVKIKQENKALRESSVSNGDSSSGRKTFLDINFFFFALDCSKFAIKFYLKNTNFPPPTSSLLRDQGGAGQALGGFGKAEGEHDEAEQALPGHTQRAGEV